jgi:hypothetical protein
VPSIQVRLKPDTTENTKAPQSVIAAITVRAIEVRLKPDATEKSAACSAVNAFIVVRDFVVS